MERTTYGRQAHLFWVRGLDKFWVRPGVRKKPRERPVCHLALTWLPSLGSPRLRPQAPTRFRKHQIWATCLFLLLTGARRRARSRRNRNGFGGVLAGQHA
jgi:hypothetical protein